MTSYAVAGKVVARKEFTKIGPIWIENSKQYHVRL